MKNKGFTLIELLAVIVILAIIALIATPVVLNIIKDSKNSSIERSAELYLSQVKNEIARYNMIHPGSNFNPSECIVQSDNTLNCDGTIVAISIDGTKPKSGSTIILSEGKVIRTRNFKIGSKNLTYEDGKIKEGTDKPICKGVTTATTGNVPSGNFNYGDEYTCDVGDGEDKTFFVLENSSDNVSLIMDKNIDSNGKGTTSGNTVPWQTDEDWAAAGGVVTDEMKNDGGVCQEGGFCFTTEYGPITALKYLKTSTTSWIKLTESQISLPTAQQIATAGGDSSWTAWTSWTDSNYAVTKLSAWLWGNLWINKTFPYSYWTSTPYESWAAWNVYDSLYYESASIDIVIGVRPVITLSKSDIQ